MRSFASRIFALFLAGFLFASAASAAPRPSTNAKQALAAQAPTASEVRQAVNRLQSWYDPKTGLWKTTGWWNSANALTTLIDFSRTVHTSRYDSVLAQTYAVNIYMGFINQYYDDEGWWALAWIDAYDLTGQ